MVPDRPSRLWLAAKVLLVLSLVPLVAAVALLAMGVENPGVQDCGSPAMFVVSDRSNERVALVGVEVTPQQRALDAQPRCADRVSDRLKVAAMAGAAFVVLAGTGAVLGLVDDRLRLRHEPAYESYLDEVEPER